MLIFMTTGFLHVIDASRTHHAEIDEGRYIGGNGAALDAQVGQEDDPAHGHSRHSDAHLQEQSKKNYCSIVAILGGTNRTYVVDKEKRRRGIQKEKRITQHTTTAVTGTMSALSCLFFLQGTIQRYSRADQSLLARAAWLLSDFQTFNFYHE